MRLLRHAQNRAAAPRVGLAARLGGWSAEHRKKAVLGWLALVLIAITAGNVGAKELSAADLTSGDSQKAERALEKAGFERPATEQVLIQTKRGDTIRAADARRAARDVVAAVKATGRVDSARSPYDRGNGGQISSDGRSALVLFTMKGERDKAEDRVEPVLKAVERVADAHPQFRIEQFGDASASKALNDSIGEDFKKAETSSIPLTFVILWLSPATRCRSTARPTR
jgi:uncharacterized membrane protein YdfJ with MMPL/SSD domain